MFLKHRKYEIIKENNDILLKTTNYIIDRFKNHWIWLDLVQIRDDCLNISGLFSSFFNTDSFNVNLIMEDKNGNKEKFVSELKYYTHNSRKNAVYLDIPWNFRYNFDVEVPLSRIKECKFYFELEFNENNKHVSYSPEVHFSFLCDFSESSAYL